MPKTISKRARPALSHVDARGRVRMVDVGEKPETVREAVADGRPYFLDIVTESPVSETPPVAAWTTAEAERPVSAGGRQ